MAIKVLPDALAGEAERLVRFQRQAEVLAALNHSDIAAIDAVWSWGRQLAQPAL